MGVIWIDSGRFAPTDPSFANVSLLLHGNGTNGSTSIIDNSPSPKTVTAVGNAQISTAESRFGGTSIAFDGAGDHLTVPSGFPVGTEDYTIEWWQKLAATNVIYNLLRLESPDTNSGILIGGGRIQLYVASVNTNYLRNFTFTLNWHHIVIERQLGSMSIFVDGIRLLAGSNQDNQAAALPSTNFSIGRRWSSIITNDFSGYVDDFRITRGIARYTANFTPPTAPFPDA